MFPEPYLWIWSLELWTQCVQDHLDNCLDQITLYLVIIKIVPQIKEYLKVFKFLEVKTYFQTNYRILKVLIVFLNSFLAQAKQEQEITGLRATTLKELNS